MQISYFKDQAISIPHSPDCSVIGPDQPLSDVPSSPCIAKAYVFSSSLPAPSGISSLPETCSFCALQAQDCSRITAMASSAVGCKTAVLVEVLIAETEADLLRSLRNGRPSLGRGQLHFQILDVQTQS